MQGAGLGVGKRFEMQFLEAGSLLFVVRWIAGTFWHRRAPLLLWAQCPFCFVFPIHKPLQLPRLHR